MVRLTKKEREALLILFKDFNGLYNANNISKVLMISHVGAQKIFKRLKSEYLVESKTIGRAIIYKLNLDDEYVLNLITFLLADEANNFKRWKEEFKAIFKEGRIIVLFGSVLNNYKTARDVDIMIILKKEEKEEANRVLIEKQEILPKKLHSLLLTKKDFIENIKKEEKVIIDIIKNSIVLYGQDQYVRLLKNVTGK